MADKVGHEGCSGPGAGRRPLPKLSTLLVVSLIANLLLLAVAWRAWIWRNALYERSAQLQTQTERLEQARRTGLARCSEALARLGARPDAVLVGASITGSLDPQRDFPGKRYTVAAIPGETSDRIRERFARDVLALHPKVVLISGDGGINRFVHNGPDEAQLQQLLEDTEAMVRAARQEQIAVVLAELLPTHASGSVAVERAQPLVLEANRRLAELASSRGVALVGLQESFAGPDGRLRRELSADGLHPGEQGRVLLARAFARALEQQLALPAQGGTGESPDRGEPPPASPGPAESGSRADRAP